MNIIKDFGRKRELEQNPRIKFKEVINWNTSWAKDKDGNKDDINLIHCLVFIYNERELIYFPTESESEEIYENYREIAEFNRRNDNTGKKWNSNSIIRINENETIKQRVSRLNNELCKYGYYVSSFYSETRKEILDQLKKDNSDYNIFLDGSVFIWKKGV